MGFLFITAQQTEKLIVPDSIQKAKFAETVEKIANMDLEKVLTNLVSESIWVGLKSYSPWRSTWRDAGLFAAS